jgi:hypothetical protein
MLKNDADTGFMQVQDMSELPMEGRLSDELMHLRKKAFSDELVAMTYEVW